MNKLLILFVALIGATVGDNYAVLVAGSNGYKNGIPKSNIITMMYDDIAYSSRNPVLHVLAEDCMK